MTKRKLWSAPGGFVTASLQTSKMSVLQLFTTSLMVCGIGAVTTACNAFESPEVVFDPQKALLLPQEQRSRYQVELFNQILVRSEPSEMLGNNNPSTEGRYQRFKRMAVEGFEPAYLALRLYDIRRGDLRRNDPQAMRRVLELAENGDATAKCLYANYYWGLNPSKELKQKLDNYIREAAQDGVPACMSYLSALEKSNPATELHWKIEAAMRGDLYAQSNLVWTYSYYEGKGVEKNLDKAACWLLEAKKSGTHYSSDAPRALNQYMQVNQPDAEYCMKLVTGEIR